MMCTDAQKAAELQQGLDQALGPSQYSRGQAGRQRGSNLRPAGPHDHVPGLGGNVCKGREGLPPFSPLERLACQ